jgi:hypothetical protein
MERQRSLFDRITIPTRVIVNRIELTTAALAETLSKGELAPTGESACELEAGGQIMARGKIVRRRGRFFFKVLEAAEEGKK